MGAGDAKNTEGEDNAENAADEEDADNMEDRDATQDVHDALNSVASDTESAACPKTYPTPRVATSSPLLGGMWGATVSSSRRGMSGAPPVGGPGRKELVGGWARETRAILKSNDEPPPRAATPVPFLGDVGRCGLVPFERGCLARRRMGGTYKGGLQ